MLTRDYQRRFLAWARRNSGQRDRFTDQQAERIVNALMVLCRRGEPGISVLAAAVLIELEAANASYSPADARIE